MAFTVKLFCGSTKPGNEGLPSINQWTYGCSSYCYQYRVPVPKDEEDANANKGPLLSLYEGTNRIAVLDLKPGDHVFIENDRGKTIDHFIGDDWRTDEEHEEFQDRMMRQGAEIAQS